MELKTIYSNIKFFIFQLICILAKMAITFEPVEKPIHFYQRDYNLMLHRPWSLISFPVSVKSWAVYGIRLYRFLIFAFHLLSHPSRKHSRVRCRDCCISSVFMCSFFLHTIASINNFLSLKQMAAFDFSTSAL